MRSRTNAWGSGSATGTGLMLVRTNSGGMGLPRGLRLLSALPTGNAGTQGVGAGVLNPLTTRVGASRTGVTYTGPIRSGTTNTGATTT